MQIDPKALDQVRDGLRHPVLTNRLDAIAMADALGAVDMLGDAFTHIAREDHQEARIRAAEAMATASSDETMQLLKEMLKLPPCPVRDAAIIAIERRQRTSGSSEMQAPEVGTQHDAKTNRVATAAVKSSPPLHAYSPDASAGGAIR
jgi:hypothetical protein